jgi:hypothetical protein
MSRRSRSSNGRGELLLSRIVMIGTLAVAAPWGALSGGVSFEAWLLPGLFALAAAAGVVGFGRVRARARWRAAWDSYAAQDGSREAIRPYQEERMLSMAGSR